MTILETAYRIATDHRLDGSCEPFQEFKSYLDSRTERGELNEKYWKRYRNSLPVFVLSLCAILVLTPFTPDPHAHPVLSWVVYITVFFLSWMITPASLVIMIWNHTKSRRYGPVRRHEEMLEKLEGFKSSFSSLTGIQFNWSFQTDCIREDFVRYAQGIHDGTAGYGDLWYRGPRRETTIADMNKVGYHFGCHFDASKATVPAVQTSQPPAS